MSAVYAVLPFPQVSQAVPYLHDHPKESGLPNPGMVAQPQIQEASYGSWQNSLARCNDKFTHNLLRVDALQQYQ